MTVEVRGLQPIVKLLEGLDDPSVFRDPMQQATKHIHREVSRYPPPSGKPQPFKTAKQRRFFFWALRTGRITVPYRRKLSGGLGGAWTTEISADGRTGRVGNNKSYAPLVQDRHEQARYHRGTWQTAQDSFHESSSRTRNSRSLPCAHAVSHVAACHASTFSAMHTTTSAANTM